MKVQVRHGEETAIDKWLMKSTLENSGIGGNSLFISQKAILPVVARASNMGSSVLIQKALKVRDDSIVLPEVTLPDPLLRNV